MRYVHDDVSTTVRTRLLHSQHSFHQSDCGSRFHNPIRLGLSKGQGAERLLTSLPLPSLRLPRGRSGDSLTGLRGLPCLFGQGVVLVEVQPESQVSQNVLCQLSLLSQDAHQTIELLAEILGTLQRRGEGEGRVEIRRAGNVGGEGDSFSIVRNHNERTPQRASTYSFILSNLISSRHQR